MPIQLCRRIRRIAPDLTHNMLSRSQLQQPPTHQGRYGCAQIVDRRPLVAGESNLCRRCMAQTNLRLARRGFTRF